MLFTFPFWCQQTGIAQSSEIFSSSIISWQYDQWTEVQLPLKPLFNQITVCICEALLATADLFLASTT